MFEVAVLVSSAFGYLSLIVIAMWRLSGGHIKSKVH